MVKYIQLAEVLSKYCILLKISEGSADAANLSAICIPSYTWNFVIAFMNCIRDGK